MKFSFYLDKRNTQQGTCRIMCRYTHNSQLTRFAAKIRGNTIRIICEAWSENSQRVKRSQKYPYHIRINQELNEIEKKANDIINQLIFERRVNPSVSLFRDLYFKGKTEGHFFDCYNKMIRQKEKERNSDTLRGHKNTLDRLKSFQNENGNISFSAIGQEFFDSYISFAERYVSERTGKGIMPRTIQKDITNIITFMNYSLKREWHSNTRHQHIDRPARIFKVAKEHKHLDMQEMFRIQYAKLPDHLSMSRDIFIFLCQSGLRIGEFLGIDRNDIAQGVLSYLKEKQKGEKERSWNRITMTSDMTAFFEKYPQGTKYKSMQTINKHLKQISEIVGIEKGISTHYGRHTFINVAAKAGVDQRVISRTAGHSSEKVTSKHYLKVVQIQDGPTQMQESIDAYREEYLKGAG